MRFLQRAADMKLLYFMVLLVFGVNADGCNTSNVQEDYRATGTENSFFYSGTEFVITESLTTSLCNWGSFRCYVQCTSVDLTTNITSLYNSMKLVQNDTITGQNNTQLVFYMNEKNTTCNVTKCESDEMNALIPNMHVKRLREVQKMCNKSFASDTYIRAEKQYFLTLINLPFDGATKTYEEENFKMTVVKMDMMYTTDHTPVKISAPKLSDDDPPIDVFVPVEPFLNVSKEQCKVSVVTYHSAQQFKTSNSSNVLGSKVIRVETGGRELKDLSNRLGISFPVNISEVILENHMLSCQFYDETENKWNDMGSFTNLENFKSSNTVICSYDHMTPFAVLLVDVAQISAQQWKILSYISYIGCSLSSFFSAVTIFLYVFMKSSDRNSSIRINVSLSVALFLLNTSFLFIEWGATWSQDSVCVVIAVIIQYSLLSCFSWMAIEAIHLYLLLIKVFNTYIKHYMVKLSLFGWGVPAVLVGGSLCVFGSKPFYGLTSVTSSSNETTHLCWITDIRFLYGMNISYFSLTFLFNICILVTVTHQIFKMRCMNASKLPSHKDICTVLSLTFLLGMTWGLAFFTSGYTNYFILYLFCICNSLQGLFLFLWFYGTMKKNRRLESQSSTRSEPASATLMSYKSSFSH